MTDIRVLDNGDTRVLDNGDIRVLSDFSFTKDPIVFTLAINQSKSFNLAIIQNKQFTLTLN